MSTNTSTKPYTETVGNFPWHKEVSVISKVFKGSVPLSNIYKWVENFEIEDRELAITLALSVRYYSENDIVEILNRRLKLIIERYPKNKVVILSIGKMEKSSYLMNYYVGRCEKSIKSSIRITSDPNTLDSEDIVVILDDFVGSGKSIKKELDKMKIENEKILLPIVAMDKGISLLKEHFDFIAIEDNYRLQACFKATSNLFRRRQKINLREFAYKYGVLCTSKKSETKPLGFRNSQSLVVFSHGTPNNSLPIFWSNLNSWKPLYPRFYPDRLSLNRQHRSNIAHEMSIIRVCRFEIPKAFSLLFRNKDFISKHDFSRYFILKSLKSKKNNLWISRVLGISSSDLDSTLEEMATNGILTLNPISLSSSTKAALSDVERSIRRKLDVTKTKPLLSLQSDYLPTRFHGVPKPR